MPKLGPSAATTITIDERILRSEAGPDAVRLEVLHALDKQGRAAKRSFEALTVGWDHKVRWVLERPQFTRGNAERSIRFPRGGSAVAAFTVSTSDKVFAFLNAGTEKRYLVMQRGFKPKTTKNSLTSEPGEKGPSGFFDMREAQAEARKIVPREFTRKWREKNEDTIRQELRDAVMRGLRKAGIR